MENKEQQPNSNPKFENPPQPQSQNSQNTQPPCQSCPNAGTSACAGCPFRKQCQSGQMAQDPTIPLVKEKLSQVKNIILILSGKGGVGKSTIASQIALTLSQDSNLQIGLMDVDICGPSIPRMLGIENEEVHKSTEGLTPVYKEENLAVMSIGFLLTDKKNAVIWRGPRKNGLIKQFLTEVIWDKLDYLIIDTPPGTSDEHLTLLNYLKEANVKGAIIVTTPQEVSLLDARKEVDFCNKTKTKVLGVVENMSGFICPHCNKSTDIFTANTGGAEVMCKEFNLDLIARIPLEPVILQSTEKGVCFVKEYKDSGTAKEIEKIVEWVKK